MTEETETVVAKRRNVPRDEHGLTPAERRMWQGMLRIADPQGLIQLASRELCKQTGVSVGRYAGMLSAIKAGGLLQVARPGGPQRAVVLRVFATPQIVFPDLPELPQPEAFRLPPRALRRDPDQPTRAERRAAAKAEGYVPREPGKRADIRLKYDARGTLLNGWAKGTADQFDIGTPAERIAKLDEAEKARIAAMYGCRFEVAA